MSENRNMARSVGNIYDSSTPSPRREDTPDKIRFVKINQNKCNQCGSCARICPTGAITISDDPRHSLPDPALCINCAQCLIACPFHAIEETVSDLDRLEKYLADPSVYTVAIVAPSTPAGFASAYRVRNTEKFRERIVGSLRTLGFNLVWSNMHGADYAIIEESRKIMTGRDALSSPPTIFTSSCPGWIKFARTFRPDLTPNISDTKPPISILGARAKNGTLDIGSSRHIVTIAIMPCVAKKYERLLPENRSDGIPDIDITVTTREIIRLIRARGINPAAHQRSLFDHVPGIGDHAQSHFKLSGSVAGGIIHRLSQNGFISRKHTRVGRKYTFTTIHPEDPAARKVIIAEIHGVENVIDKGMGCSAEPDIIEVMACHGGCRHGGGQPVSHGFFARWFAAVRQRIRPFHPPIKPLFITGKASYPKKKAVNDADEKTARS